MHYLLISSVDDKKIHYAYAENADLCRTLIAQSGTPQPLQSPLTFSLGWDGVLDYISIASVAMGHLCSQRFLEVLVRNNIPCTIYPAWIVDWSTKSTLDVPYYLWAPQRIEGAIDWEQSEVWMNPETGEKYVTKLVLGTQYAEKGPLHFQEKGRVAHLIHEHLREHLLAEGVTGIDFAPLDAV